MGMNYTSGTWTEPAGSPLWLVLMFLGRAANYVYEVKFSEDFQRADIAIKGNPFVLCCCCFPCCPSWFTVPCTEQYMIQSDDSIKGDHWLRYRGSCFKEAKFYYDLKAVYDASENPTRFEGLVAEKAPAQV